MYNRELLKFISEASHTEGFATVAAEWASELKKMESGKLVDIDPGSPDGDGNIRVAVTDAGDLWLDPSEGAKQPVFAAPVAVASAPKPVPVPTFAAPPLIAPSEAPKPVWIGIDLAQSRAEGMEPINEASPIPEVDWNNLKPLSAETMREIEAVSNPYPAHRELENETVLNKSPPDPIVGTGIVAGLAPPPPKVKRGRKTKPNPYQEYIDSMDAGMAFYIAPTDEKKNPIRDYYYLVHSANIKYSEILRHDDGTAVVENKTRNKSVKNEDGSYRLDENGAKIREAVTIGVVITKPIREYAIYPAKEVPNQPYVDGAYVFRLK
jgi:hypothetical protein